MWIVDEIIRFFQAQTREQYHVSKALNGLEKSFSPEDVYASVAMREVIEKVRLDILHDRGMLETLMQQPGMTTEKAASRLLLSEARRRLDDERNAIALSAMHRGMFAVEAHAAKQMRP